MAGDVYVSFGAATGDLEAAFSLAKAQTKALASEMSALAREMAKTGASADGDMGSKLHHLGAELAEAKARMRDMTASLRETRAETHGGFAGLAEAFRSPLESIERMRGSIASVAELVAGAFAVEKLREWTREAMEAASQTQRMAAMLGASTRDVQMFRAAAMMTDSDAGEMATMIERLQLALAKTSDKASPAAVALKALNINVAEFRALSPLDQISAVAEEFSRYADGANKTAIALALFGRAGAQMIPFLDKGRAGMEELTKAIEETGVVLDEGAVKKLDAAEESTKKFGLATQALKQDMVLNMIAPIQSAVEWLTTLTEKLDEAAKHARGAPPPVIGLGGYVPSPYADIPLLDPTGSVLNAAIGGGARRVIVHAKKPQAPALNFPSPSSGGSSGGSNDAANAARQQFQEQIRLAEEAASEQRRILDANLSTHRISTQTWQRDTKASLEAEIAAMRAMYDEEARIADLTATQIAQIKKQEAVAITRLNNEIAAAARRASATEQQQWESTIGSIVSEVNGQLRGLLSGSTSWKEAMVSIFEDLALKAIEALEKIAIEEIAVKLVGSGIGLGIPGFAVGAWSLPSDTLAMVHKGEMIVPSGPAAAMRNAFSSSGGGGGGGGGSVNVHPTTHITVQTIDGASTAAWARNRGPELMKGLEQAARQGAALGLRGFR